ncbi:MAG: hypothetical protein AAF735_01610 [Myxococcota bacterium]
MFGSTDQASRGFDKKRAWDAGAGTLVDERTSEARETAREALSRLIDAADPWGVLHALGESEVEPKPLVELAMQAWEHATHEQRRRLVLLLERLDNEFADDTLVEWLSSEGFGNALDVMRAINSRRLRVPLEMVASLLGSGEPGLMRQAIAAVGVSGHKELAGQIAAFLDSEGLRMHAAIALGRLGAKDYTDELVSRLEAVSGCDYTGFVVALELMDDSSAIEGIRSALGSAPAEHAWDLSHALWKLSKRDPVVDASSDIKTKAEQIRNAWKSAFERAPSPRLEGLTTHGPRLFELVVVDGSGRIYFDYDPPTPASSWPRWDRSLYIDGEPLYRVGSHCGTCETHLALAGWQPRHAAVLAARLRRDVEDVAELSESLVDALAPLLTSLRSGRFCSR